jgi:hypothetical protein
VKISESGLNAVSAIHKTGTIQASAMLKTRMRLTVFLRARDLNTLRSTVDVGRASDSVPEAGSGIWSASCLSVVVNSSLADFGSIYP